MRGSLRSGPLSVSAAPWGPGSPGDAGWPPVALPGSRVARENTRFLRVVERGEGILKVFTNTQFF